MASLADHSTYERVLESLCGPMEQRPHRYRCSYDATRRPPRVCGRLRFHCCSLPSDAGQDRRSVVRTRAVLPSFRSHSPVPWRRISMEVNCDTLRSAVESLHSCRATLAQTASVREAFHGRPVWEGVVHVFDLKGHPTATRAYAWSSPIEGSEKRRFFAVLHTGGIKSPADAVRAAIVAEQRSQA
jgi:hypothetical protein